MGTFFRVILALALVAVAVGIGAGIYNAGISTGLTEAALQAAASGEAVPVVPAYGHGYGYGPYWHGPWGFGFFGIIFWILGAFLIIGLLRAAFGWGRWGGPGHGGRGGRREMVEEWHRELHRRDAPDGERTAGA
ncbi:MAG: hypothetical protein ACRDHD_03535 [Candidatus Limnocylindria bacterium]